MVLLSWDSSVLDMGLRVKKEKILMVMHLRSLSEDTLARQIYEEQFTNNWPGLALETRKICEELGLEDCNTVIQDKALYKKTIISACHAKNEENVRKLDMGKCGKINIEEYGRKAYFRKKEYFQCLSRGLTFL